jgi:hypothetical protein
VLRLYNAYTKGQLDQHTALTPICIGVGACVIATDRWCGSLRVTSAKTAKHSVI